MSKSIIPSSRTALDKFKMEAANEVGVNLQEGYNGHLTSHEAGSIGGQMVNIISTERKHFARVNRKLHNHTQTIAYTFSFFI